MRMEFNCTGNTMINQRLSTCSHDKLKRAMCY